MTPALMAQGFELMVYGMGTVIVFLGVLVFAMRSMSWAVQRWFPDPVMASPAGIRPQAPRPLTAASDSIDPEILAVIASAVHAHRMRGTQDP